MHAEGAEVPGDVSVGSIPEKSMCLAIDEAHCVEKW